MAESLAKKAVTGTIWSAIDKFGVMALQFIIYVVLARVLSPADFGALNMIMIFIFVSMACVDGGFSSALVQKKHSTQTDYSTIFFWGMGIGLIFYLIIFAASGPIASFYNMPILKPLLQVIGITLIFSGMASTQTARLQKHLQFRELALVNVGTYILAGTVAIIMAFNGFGVWSLVVMTMAQTIGKVLILYLVTRWLPSLIFSVKSFKRLFSFSGFLFLNTVMETISNNIQGIVIGKKFNATQLGYYSQASRLEYITGTSIPQIIAVVMYPIFSQFQDDKPKLRSIITLDHRVVSFIIYPLLTVLMIFAPNVISLIYGDKWLPAVPYYRILMCGAFFICLKNINSYAVAACGKSKSLFYASIYQWSVLAVLLLVGSMYGMIGIVWAFSINMFNVFLSYATLSKIHTGQPYSALIKALAPSMALCILTGTLTVILNVYTSIWWPINILFFAILYIVLAKIFRVRALNESVQLINKVMVKQK